MVPFFIRVYVCDGEPVFIPDKSQPDYIIICPLFQGVVRDRLCQVLVGTFPIFLYEDLFVAKNEHNPLTEYTVYMTFSVWYAFNQ